MFSGWGDWWDRPWLTNCNGLSKMELDRPLESGWIQNISAECWYVLLVILLPYWLLIISSKNKKWIMV